MSAVSKQILQLPDGTRYVLKKKIEIKYKRPTLFSGPKMEIERFHSLTPFYANKEYKEFIGQLENVLLDTYIPMWKWVLLFICSLGLFGWVIIFFQKRKTIEQGERLKDIVTEENKKLIKKIFGIKNQDKNDQEIKEIKKNKLLLYEIPFPSKNRVILHACFYEKILGNEKKS